MQTINIDDEVFVELEKRATGFHLTENDVLRRILQLPSVCSTQSPAKDIELTPMPATATRQNITEYVRSEAFQRNHQTVDRFLLILGWLQDHRSVEFADAARRFRRGKRLYFGESEREILERGEGVTAKPIPGSRFWVLTTLDNKSKRIVLEDILRALKIPRGDINLVLSELPDSGIRRNHGKDPERLLRSA